MPESRVKELIGLALEAVGRLVRLDPVTFGYSRVSPHLMSSNSTRHQMRNVECKCSTPTT